MTKKAAKAPASKAGTIKVGQVVKDGSVELVERKTRTSPYVSVFEQMKLLKKDQMFLVPVPEGVTLAAFRDRFVSAKRYAGIKAPAGCKFATSPTKEGKALAVRCVGEK